MTIHSIPDQIGAVEREIAMRCRLYPRWVKQEKLTQASADLQIDLMRSVRETLIKAGPILAERAPGALPGGEFKGPAKVREETEAAMLKVLFDTVSEPAYHTFVTAWQRAKKAERAPGSADV